MAPLRKADDAVEIDTTGMTIAEVIEAVCALAEASASVAAGRAPHADAAPASRRQEVAAVAAWSAARSTRWLYRFAYSLHPAAVAPAVPHEDQRAPRTSPLTGAVLLVPATTARTSIPSSSGVAFPRQIHFMAKAELWKFKPLGWLHRHAGHLSR